MYASIVVETMDSIVLKILVIRIVLNRTRISLKKQGTTLQVEVALVEDVLVVVSIIRANAFMEEKAWSDQHCLYQS